MQQVNEPGVGNSYLYDHAELLITSCRRLTGNELVERGLTGIEKSRALYDAPYGVVSHNTGDDPVFNYGNRTALRLFQMDWSQCHCSDAVGEIVRITATKTIKEKSIAGKPDNGLAQYAG